MVPYTLHTGTFHDSNNVATGDLPLNKKHWQRIFVAMTKFVKFTKLLQCVTSSFS